MPTLVPIWGCNLGDTLWVTPLTRYIDDVVVQMLGHDARSRSTAQILDNLCEVEWVKSTGETPKTYGQIHVTQRILQAYGHGGKPSIPRVVLMSEEIIWALKFLREQGVNPVHAVAITNHNSGSGDPTNARAHYVRPPRDVIQTLARFWKAAGYSVVQFGPAPTFHDRDPFDPLEGTIQIRGLSVRQLAACYHVIGKWIGGDTGDVHLMLAVGGKAAMLHPPHSEAWGYLHWDLLYDKVCWGEERPRVHYALHSQWHTLMNTRLFLDL
jgi:hypothetical protein